MRRPNDMVLYHCPGARSFRVLWMLEEAKAEYQLKLLPFPPRVRSPGFLGINPLGTVPALVADGALLTESAAILEFLAAQYPEARLAIAPHEPDYGLYLNLLHMGEATLTFPQTIYLRYSRLEEAERRHPQVAEDYRRWFRARVTVALEMLQGEYACGHRFTAADISVGYALMLAEMIGLGGDLPPAASAYRRRLEGREACMRAANLEKRCQVSEG